MQFDDEFLEKVGLGALPEERKADFLEYLQESLEIRVGQRMSEGMSDAQLLEFDEIAKSGDVVATQDWIRTNRPDYQEIAKSELRRMTEELMVRKDEILAGSR
ncbi:hypothetical protein IJ096_00550 [Candidatus Saccharibacteria bacterium]|nr:hypothetical protein [Candidatus Saccharibacteria bacterium]